MRVLVPPRRHKHSPDPSRRKATADPEKGDKELAQLPYVAPSNDHNEYGLVMPERPQLFRVPNSDVIRVCDRGNVDFRVMERGCPHADDMDAHIHAAADSLRRCFPDIPFLDISQPLVRRMVHNVVALHVAAHN